MKIGYRLSDAVYGGLIYGIGDSIATLILGDLGWIRLLGMVTLGATLYAIEIPNYFKWIDKKMPAQIGFYPKLKRTMLAILYFNPLWIARHLLFIKLFSLQFDEINLGLISIAFFSFLGTIPIGILGNYIIQNRIKIDKRYIASSIYSALMAIYYAMSTAWFA